MSLVANSFDKCGSAISNNIAQCGTITQCNASPMTEGDLTTAYQDTGEYRVMEALFMTDFDGKMCGSVQNTLWDFFMSVKVDVSKKINSKRINSGLIEIAPFIMMRQRSPINMEYWIAANGQTSGANWSVTVTATDGVPLDERLFNIGERIWIQGATGGGTKTSTAWVVVTSTLAAGVLTLVMSGQNANSQLPAAALTSPVTGLLVRGTANVNDYEEFCEEGPAHTNWKNVPFWVETVRHSHCKDELYDKYRKLLLEGNALYKEFGDLDTIERNKQLTEDFQRRFVQTMFHNKALPNQNMTDYDALTEITAHDSTVLTQSNGGRCVGKRANAVGIYEQLVDCGQVFDHQGGVLNIPNLLDSLYTIMRQRKTNGHPKPNVIDIFTDSTTAHLWNRAMIEYYDNEAGGRLRLNKQIDREVKEAEFGFNYESYKMFWPAGMVINIITHDFFDDWISAAAAAGVEDTARVLWILDFTGIYPGILGSNRVVHKTGDLRTLASVDTSFACVMKVPTREQTLSSITWTMIVECPQNHLIIENFGTTQPEAVTPGGNDYLGNQTTTTTTTAAP